MEYYYYSTGITQSGVSFAAKIELGKGAGLARSTNLLSSPKEKSPECSLSLRPQITAELRTLATRKHRPETDGCNMKLSCIIGTERIRKFVYRDRKPVGFCR